VFVRHIITNQPEKSKEKKHRKTGFPQQAEAEPSAPAFGS